MRPEIQIMYIVSVKNNISFYNLASMNYGDEQDKLTYELLILSSYINSAGLKSTISNVLQLADTFSEFINSILPAAEQMAIDKMHIKQLLGKMPK